METRVDEETWRLQYAEHEKIQIYGNVIIRQKKWVVYTVYTGGRGDN